MPRAFRAPWRSAQRTVSDNAAPVRDAFARGVRRLLAAADALDTPNEERAAQAWGAFDAALAPGLRETRARAFAAGFRAAMRDAPRFRAKARPQPVELQLAIAWADAEGGRLIRQISEDTRAAVQGVVTQGIALGASPRVVEREIRDVVGLTDREARAVLRRRATLEAQGAANAGKLTAAYRDRLVAVRATRIARTEIIAARNEGTLQGWQLLRSEGGLPTERMGKQWIAALSIACPRCAPLHLEVVPIDARFSNGLMRPPDHPNCRCSMGLAEMK